MGWKRERRKLPENKNSLCFLIHWDDSKQPHTSASVPSPPRLTVPLRLSARVIPSCFKLLIESELWLLAWGWEEFPDKIQQCSSTLPKPLVMRKKKVYSYFSLHFSLGFRLNCLDIICGDILVCLVCHILWHLFNEDKKKSFSHPVCSHVISKSNRADKAVYTSQTFLCSKCVIY